jgi:hypothetical protein
MGLVQALQAAVLYFLLVFGAGFLLGIGRVLFLVPRLGERTAELLEMPVMLVVIVISARWIVLHRLNNRRQSSALVVGFTAMGLVLLADVVVGLWLRGMSFVEVFSHRDPVSGAAYFTSLLLLTIMPAIVARLRQA